MVVPSVSHERVFNSGRVPQTPGPCRISAYQPVRVNRVSAKSAPVRANGRCRRPDAFIYGDRLGCVGDTGGGEIGRQESGTRLNQGNRAASGKNRARKVRPMYPETPEQERASIWREREELRKKLTQLPDTIWGAQRTEEISAAMRRLKARYKELGGVLYDDDDDG